jgi:hypothetical protein
MEHDEITSEQLDEVIDELELVETSIPEAGVAVRVPVRVDADTLRAIEERAAREDMDLSHALELALRRGARAA